MKVLDVLDKKGHEVYKISSGSTVYDAVEEMAKHQVGSLLVINENKEIEGIVTEITEFGAFVNFGPMDGLVHVSQVTEDFVGYDMKNASLVGKESKKIKERQQEEREARQQQRQQNQAKQEQKPEGTQTHKTPWSRSSPAATSNSMCPETSPPKSTRRPKRRRK